MWKTLFCCWIGIASVALRAPSAQAQIPDNPQPQYLSQKTVCLGIYGCGWHQYTALPPEPVGFWSFRKSWQDPPLRTNRQVFTSKVFLVTHGLAAVAMIVACKRKGSGEEWGSEIPAVAAITGMDYVATRLFSESMSVEEPAYAIGHYVWSAAK